MSGEEDDAPEASVPAGRPDCPVYETKRRPARQRPKIGALAVPIRLTGRDRILCYSEERDRRAATAKKMGLFRSRRS